MPKNMAFTSTEVGPEEILALPRVGEAFADRTERRSDSPLGGGAAFRAYNANRLTRKLRHVERIGQRQPGGGDHHAGECGRGDHAELSPEREDR